MRLSFHQGVQGPHSANDTAKRRADPEILDQVLHAAQMSTQQLLLLIRRKLAPHLAAISPPAVRGGGGGRSSSSVREGARELTGAALQHGGDRVALSRAGDGGHLGHEVEVEELDELELDLAGRGARLEERRDGEEAVEGLKGARVTGRVDEGDDEREEGRRLDRGAVVRLEEVEEELCQRGLDLT